MSSSRRSLSPQRESAGSVARTADGVSLDRPSRDRSSIVIEHDYTSLDAFRNERAAFHDDPGSIGEVLARLSELAVPGTATEFEFDGVELGCDAAE